jgi:hypothetical protein
VHYKIAGTCQGIGRGTMDGSNGLPVSVKTRIGYASAGEMEGWINCPCRGEAGGDNNPWQDKGREKKGRRIGIA